MISQCKNYFGKHIISQICGFFQHCLALFNPLTTRYNDPGKKFEFFDQFQYIKSIKVALPTSVLSYVLFEKLFDPIVGVWY